MATDEHFDGGQWPCVGAFGHCAGLEEPGILGINNGARPGSTEVPQFQFIDFVVVEAELECIIKKPVFGGLVLSFPWVLALFALGKRCIILLIPVFGSLSRCLGVACGIQ